MKNTGSRPPAAGEEGSASFGELGTASFFAARLSERGILRPTEIQRLVIPRLLSGENLLFRAPTGTGKTFAYLIPLFQRFLLPQGEGPGPYGPRLLIAAPTYELCSQIKGEADFLLRGLGGEGRPDPRTGLVIGSANMGRQIDTLKKEKPAVIVGNPGRLLQLARMGRLKFGALASLVLDEADRLGAEEMAGETGALLGLIAGTGRPPGFITAACSATLSAKSRERFPPFFEAAEFVEARGQEILRERIEHWAFFCEGRRKIAFLRSFLAAAKPKKALVFTGRGGEAGKIAAQLQYHGVSALGLYGDMDKKGRKAAADAFRSGKTSVLVSSDLAARGLDIPGITHIIALDVPQEGDAYIHRAGRTARAGKRGIMVSIGDGEEMRRLAALEKRLGIRVCPKELYGGRVVSPPA